jgi:hypothetical protein
MPTQDTKGGIDEYIENAGFWDRLIVFHIMGKPIIDFAKLIEPIEDTSPENERVVHDGIVRLIHIFLGLGAIIGILFAALIMVIRSFLGGV